MSGRNRPRPVLNGRQHAVEDLTALLTSAGER